MCIWHPKMWAPGSVALPNIPPKWGIPHATWARYEYKCPHCGFVNIRSVPTYRIICTRCGRVFTP